MAQGGSSLLFLVFMVAIFYFVLVLPQQRRVKRHQAVVATLRPGDEVVTIGGLYGYVKELDDTTVSLEIAPGVVVRYARSAVRDKVTRPATTAEEPQDLDGGA